MNSIARPITLAAAWLVRRDRLVKLLAASLTLSLSSCMSGILLGALLTPDDPPLPAPKVITGASLLESHRIATLPEIGEVTDIEFGRVDGDGHERLVIAGTLGYALVDPYFDKVVRTVPFEPTLAPPFEDAAIDCHILDVDGDGAFEFARLSDGFGRSSLHGCDGGVIWAEPNRLPCGASSGAAGAAGDVDGDGKLEFIIRFGGEVRLLEHDGRVRWTQTWEDDGRYLFLDVDGDGRNEIVYVDGAALCARDSNGRLVVSTRMPEPGHVSAVWLVRSWGTTPVDALVVRMYGEQHGRTIEGCHLVGLDAKTVGDAVKWKDIETRVDAIKLDFPDRPELAWVARDYLEQGAYFAGVEATRLHLRITDNSNKVQYDEIIEAPHQHAVATGGACFFLPASDGRPARLFVGYGPAVWEYEVRE